MTYQPPDAKPSAGERINKWVRANPKLAAGVGGVVLIVVIVAAASGGGSSSPSSPSGTTTQPTQPTHTAKPVHVNPKVSAITALRAALNDKLGSSNVDNQQRVINVETTGHFLSIHWGVNDNLTGGLRVGGAKRDVVDILNVVHQNEQLFPTMTAVGTFGMFPLQDKFGKVKEGQVVTYNFTRSVIDRISYDNVNPDSIGDLAKFGGINPVLG